MTRVIQRMRCPVDTTHGELMQVKHTDRFFCPHSWHDRKPDETTNPRDRVWTLDQLAELGVAL